MNAPTRLWPVDTIPSEQIHALIAAANRLLANPERDGVAHLGVLCAVDTLDGHGALEGRIADQESEHDLGLSDEPTCLVCEEASCGCDARYDDLSLAFVERISPTRIAL